MIRAFIEQGGVDFGRREIGEAGLAEKVEHDLPFRGLECSM